jgi:TusA-related sulfurtransferase
MNRGETAEIRLSGGEPLENVPQSVTELGHTVLDLTREEGSPGDGIFRILIRKN